MTDREIMEALLAGKTLECQLTTSFLVLTMGLDEHGQIVVKDGPKEYPRYAFRERSGEWRIHQPPNPHTQGTFAWAVEECRRGRKVRRPDWSKSGFYNEDSVRGGFIAIDEALATDWEVVP